ncbi:MAG: tetratricopeptide repeat protein [Nitrospirota bacterium]|nr:tetratricopeptide repeat protein [Nitrospirota bacterium]
MKNRIVVLCGVALLGLGMLTACGESPKKTLETAKFEEQQGNLEHAGKLYQQIIQQKPDSPEAAEAKAAMARIMEKQGGPQ